MLLVCLFRANLFAQKLPNVQKTSVYAPAGIKIDGKTTEWNDKFEAKNGATSIAYTIANDDDNLYLAIQVTDGPTINKILSGGFKLKIIGANKADQPVVLSGMLVQPTGRGSVSQKLKDKDAKTDSLIAALNAQINGAIKDINFTGVKDIADTTISVYNEYDIKQAVKLDANRALNCEVAIPLKYINHLIIGGVFKYNLMLPGMNMGAMQVTVNGVKQSASSLASMPGVQVVMHGSGGGDFQSLFNATDLSGSYTLAKK
ncbi:hypothetical protein GCM10028827_36050 [Mucilaginibacter myungsuensis]